MHVAFQPHWLESAIGERRSPSEIAEAIANHSDFHALITESVQFAQQNGDDAQRTRLIAEHIVFRLSKTMSDFTTTH